MVSFFGLRPTPVLQLENNLFVKRDDLTSPYYGGNKARKLAFLLGDARARKKRRVITVGAAGSHHVLATSLFASMFGMETEAILLPQQLSLHALDNLRAGLVCGLRVQSAQDEMEAACKYFTSFCSGVSDAYFIPPGGSNLLGARAYEMAAKEYLIQVENDEAERADIHVIALGSGGSAAGLTSGLRSSFDSSEVHAVLVSEPTWPVLFSLKWQLFKLFEKRYVKPKTAFAFLSEPFFLKCRHLLVSMYSTLSKMKFDLTSVYGLSVIQSYRGLGYGLPLVNGYEVIRDARVRYSLQLDDTYTAKTFAYAQRLAAERPEKKIIYWHTLSSVSLKRYLDKSQSRAEVLATFPQLFRHSWFEF